MAYEKQTWQTGDVITQEKLNHMEDGIAGAGGGGGVQYVDVTESSPLTLSKTYAEIRAMIENGDSVVIRDNRNYITRYYSLNFADAESIAFSNIIAQRINMGEGDTKLVTGSANIAINSYEAYEYDVTMERMES